MSTDSLWLSHFIKEWQQIGHGKEIMDEEFLNKVNKDEDLSEEEREELIAFREWWDMYVPKEALTIINPALLDQATKSIKAIHAIIENRIREEDERPEYSIDYDTLYGTMLGFSIILTEYGVKFTGEDIKNIAETLPENAVIRIQPLKDYKTKILITYKNVKLIIS